MKFDFEAARSAGYSDDEIAGYLAKENNFDLSGALKSGYSATDVIDYLAKVDSPVERNPKQELPADIKPSEGRSATPMGKEDPRLAKPRDDRGIIQRVGDFLKPEYKSVMEGYQPTPQEQQANTDRRLSYGAGPISSQTEAKADLVRSGMANTEDQRVKQVAQEMDRRKQPSFGDLVQTAKNETNIKAARDTKAAEFRSAGEWAADTLSNLAQGTISLAQLPTDIIAPSSALAKSLRETQKELQGQESSVLQAQRDQLRERVQNESGFFDKYAATVVQLATNPALGLSEAVKQVPMFLGVVGTARAAGAAVGVASNVSPTLALAEALSGNAVRGSATAAGGAAASMVMAGGDAAGGVYEKLTDRNQTPLSVWQQNPDFQRLKADGKSDKEAIEEIATAKARLAAVVTAPLGLLGFMGAESALASKGLGKATSEALTIAGAGKFIAKDVVGEQLEEGGTQFGGNVVSRTVDPNQKLSEGVPEAMGTALVTTAPYAAVGARSQYKEALDANKRVDLAGDQIARDLLNPESYDPSIVNPMQTAKIANFTPADAPTKQAGLVDIEVPLPNAPAPVLPEINTTTEQEFGLDTLRMGDGNVSTGSAPQTEVAGGGNAGGNQLGGGVGLSGSDVNGAGGLLGGRAGLPAANAGQDVLAGNAGNQSAANLAPKNNNADTQPAEQWFGRKGDGYATQADAQQALGGRERMFPSLDWKIEKMPSGKFRLAGYNSETNLGNQTAQTQQTETQGQQQASATGAVATAGAQATAAAGVQGVQSSGLTLADEDRTKLKVAAPAPVKAITAVRNEILKTGVDMSVVPVAEIDDQQRVASALLRSLGKTLTVVRSESGPAQLSNGMINSLGGKHVFIAEDTEDAPLFVATHEAYHGLPADKRKALNTALLELFNEDQKADFLKRFDYTEDKFDEEAPAFMAQAISKRADFWDQLRTKLGDAEFVDVAKVILAKFKEILTGARKDYGDDFVSRYIKDIERAQDLLSTAYAEAIKANQEAEKGTAVAASNRVDIGAKLQERIDADFDGAVAEYSQLKGAEGGRLLDTDLVRELSPEYRADRSRAPEVHEAASAMTQRMFEQRLQENTGIVAFMAGGGGAGKSSAQDLLLDKLSAAHTILDGTLSGYEKARRNVQLALDTGNRVVIAYIYREPVEALRNGVLTRAMSKGRTVTLDALVKGHAGSSEVVRKLEEEFGSNPRFKLYAIDNSKGAGKAEIVPRQVSRL